MIELNNDILGKKMTNYKYIYQLKIKMIIFYQFFQMKESKNIEGF
jgi:hypothetical protein